MKQLLSKTVFLALVFAGFAFSICCQAQVVQAGVNNTTPNTGVVELIQPAVAARLIASTPALQVLDVRTPEEVAGGKLKGAKTISWFDADFADHVQTSFDKTKPVLVYCKVGGRSAQAASVMVQKGFTHVYDLKGGITKWIAEGHPVGE